MRRNRAKKIGWGFSLPGLATLGLVIGLPLIYAALMSLSSMTLLHPSLLPFVGFDNYARITQNAQFWHSLFITVKYSVVTVIAEFTLGLGVALMLNAVIHAKPIYFAILTIPMAMAPVSVALVWRMLLQPNLGIVNHLMELIALPRVDWLGSGDLALWSMAAIDIWQQTSFVILILAAGLAALPRDPYEAAEMDGAGKVQQFWYLTLPMLRPVAAIAIIIQLINEFRTYDLTYVLTKGGPGTATEVLSFFAYRQAFLGLSLNDGAAASFILSLIVLGITILFFWLLERRRTSNQPVTKA